MVKSSTRLPPDTFFRLLLLTLLSYQQNSGPPTSMSTDDGAAPYLLALLEATSCDTKYGFRLAPWITPTIATAELPLTWTCLSRDYAVNFNHNLSFCLGSTTGGVVKPYFVTNTGAVRTDTLTTSIEEIFVLNEPYSRVLGLATHASCNSLTWFFAPWNRTFSPHPLGTALHLNFDLPPTQKDKTSD